MLPATDRLETLWCGSCDAEWQRTRVRGSKPSRCPACIKAAEDSAMAAADEKRRQDWLAKKQRQEAAKLIPRPRDEQPDEPDELGESECRCSQPGPAKLGAVVTRYRMAIQIAAGALRAGRSEEALAMLEQAEAPGMHR